MPSSKEYIHLRGARQNNLKGFDLDLPIDQPTAAASFKLDAIPKKTIVNGNEFCKSN